MFAGLNIQIELSPFCPAHIQSKSHRVSGLFFKFDILYEFPLAHLLSSLFVMWSVRSGCRKLKYSICSYLGSHFLSVRQGEILPLIVIGQDQPLRFALVRILKAMWTYEKFVLTKMSVMSWKTVICTHVRRALLRAINPTCDSILTLAGL